MQETRIYSSPKIPFFYKKSSEMISDDFLRFIFFTSSVKFTRVYSLRTTLLLRD